MFPLRRATIDVTVEAHGLAAQYVAPGSYKVREGSTVGKLLDKASTARRRPPLVLMIGGERVETSRALAAGDVVKVLGFAAGG